SCTLSPLYLYTLSLHDALPISGRSQELPVHFAGRREPAINDGDGRRVACGDCDFWKYGGPWLRQRRSNRHHHGTLPERASVWARSEEHKSELQSLRHLVCRLLL